MHCSANLATLKVNIPLSLFCDSVRIRCLIFLFSFAFLSTPSLSNAQQHRVDSLSADTSLHIAPVLVREPDYSIPLIALKRGLQGKSVVKAYIDDSGMVESCSLITHIDPLLDSLSSYHVKNSLFSPAYEQGKPVASIIRFEIDYEPTQMAKTFSMSSPQLCGTVIGEQTGEPIGGARINLQYIDTTVDTTISTGYEEFFKLADEIPGQSFSNGLFSTHSDSNGYFDFRLLPPGRIYIGVISPGYRTQKTAIDIKESSTAQKKFFMEEYVPESEKYEIVVQGQLESGEEQVVIDESDKFIGLTHSVSEILQAQPVINRSIKSKSAMVVRGGSPYDNMYLIRGVPFSAPFHFGGYSFGEIDALTVVSLNHMDVVVNSVAGYYPSISGVVIEADPDVSRALRSGKYARPQVVIDFSDTGADILVSFKTRKIPGHSLQLGFKGANAYMLKWNRNRYNLSEDALTGIGYPIGFGDLTANWKFPSDNAELNTFVWFAWDSYNRFEGVESDPFEVRRADETIPWGMASMQIEPRKIENLKISVGGGRQYFVEGKRNGINAFLNKTYLTNAMIMGEMRERRCGNLKYSLRGRIDHELWQGQLKQRDLRGLDTAVDRESRRYSGHLHGSLEYEHKKLSFGARLVGGGRITDENLDFSCDPGISAEWSDYGLTVGASSGLVCVYPDYRGLPDKKMQQLRMKSYIGSLKLLYTGLPWLHIHLEPYLRIQDKVPRLDPATFTWEEKLPGGLLAKGIDAQVDIVPSDWLSTYLQLSFMDAHRKGTSEKDIYEWEIPYTVKCGVRASFLEEIVSLNLHGFIRDGNYYYDFSSHDYQRLNQQIGGRFKAQISIKNIEHRYFYRWDVYTGVESAFKGAVVKDYYWDEDMKKREIIGEGFAFTLGIKTAFRL